MQICNACRYCEGFCAVFPAMTRRLDFKPADVHYLANLCHNCGACLHACQYAPPHEFAVNVPQAMARCAARPMPATPGRPALGALYRRNGLTAGAGAGGRAGAVPGAGRGGRAAGCGGRCRAATSTPLPAQPDGRPVRRRCSPSRCWRWASACAASGARTAPGPAFRPAAAEAVHDALRLKYLDGGHGEGCNNADDAFTLARRRFHHFTFYGFMLCFAATSVATLYHYAVGLGGALRR
jgi:citrate/tricarballylate utilization protein